MLNMQPYQDPTYFVLLAIGLLPIMVGLLYGRRFRVYETIISFLFLLLTFGGVKWQQGVALIGYIIFELLLIYGYLAYRKRKNASWIFNLTVILSILPLVIVKIAPVMNNGRESIIGFLGISYLTFKAVGMIMEIRDGIIKEVGLSEVVHFLLFFPTISSGPIDRYRRFLGDYKKVPARDKYLALLDKAMWYIFLGFVYKFLLAYLFGVVMLPKISALALAHGGWSWWVICTSSHCGEV